MWFDATSYLLDKDPKGEKEYHTYLKNGLLIDTLPLTLLILGAYDTKHHTNFLNRQYNYTLSDYSCLRKFLNGLSAQRTTISITPHILTEFLNHLQQSVKNPKDFTSIIQESDLLTAIQEEQIAKETILKEKLLLNKALEIGEISLILVSQTRTKKMAILSQDEMALIKSDQDFGLLAIHYTDIRNAFNSFPIDAF